MRSTRSGAPLLAKKRAFEAKLDESPGDMPELPGEFLVKEKDVHVPANGLPGCEAGKAFDRLLHRAELLVRLLQL
jgi:hypothetical protein